MSAAPKKVAPKKPAAHPAYKEMVAAAITALASRNGSSMVAIGKYVTENYNVNGERCSSNLKLALKRGLESGALVKVKGLGCTGSFKLAKPVKKVAPKKKPAPKKKVAPKKKPAAKKKAATPKKKAAGTPKKKAAPKKKVAAKKATPKKKTKKVAAKKKVAKKAK